MANQPFERQAALFDACIRRHGVVEKRRRACVHNVGGRVPRALVFLFALAFLFETWIWGGVVAVVRRLVALVPWVEFKAALGAHRPPAGMGGAADVRHPLRRQPKSAPFSA